MFVLQESCKLKFHLARISQDAVYRARILQDEVYRARILQDEVSRARILQDEVYLARILQETCHKNALSCKIFQDILQDSCKICIF